MDQPSFQELSFLANNTLENQNVYKKWNKQDRKIFYQLYKKFGTDFDQYQQYFPGRTVKQIKYFYNNEKHKNKVNKQKDEPNTNVPQYLFKNLQNVDQPRTDYVANTTDAKDNQTNQTRKGDESLHTSDEFFQ
ncbi:SANT/Myb_domain [Hexamita inflata]|uniref:SANT/Myb domain n=1 Tax=Hexamita inflata TaxID=28002 RepID=A0AA86UCP6_9EUKA|nr:SANT/Myb domain [Hexamita inflata]